jgi:hypothetical protein
VRQISLRIMVARVGIITHNMADNKAWCCISVDIDCTISAFITSRVSLQGDNWTRSYGHNAPKYYHRPSEIESDVKSFKKMTVNRPLYSYEDEATILSLPMCYWLRNVSHIKLSLNSLSDIIKKPKPVRLKMVRYSVTAFRVLDTSGSTASSRKNVCLVSLLCR